MADTVVLGNYRITLRAGFPQCTNNQQTWSYMVELVGQTPPGQEISNWALELCRPEHIVLSSSPQAVVEDNPQPCLAAIPTVERQIKWDNLSDETLEMNNIFTFTLQGCFEPTDVNIAVKTGGAPGTTGCLYGLITGPSCEPQNGNGNGIRRGVIL
jgi:hypothetical protein